MKLKFEDGTTREVEALDINVWNADMYGDGEHSGVVVTAYPMEKLENGNWHTHQDLIVFSASTDLDPDVWGDDEWYSLSDDTAPGEFPHEVGRIVENVLKEISQ